MKSLSLNQPWLTEGLLVVLVAGLVLALAVGLLLLASPRALFTLNLRLSRWVDTRGAFAALDQPRNLERFFYRHHLAVGGLIVLGCGYVLLRWGLYYERSAAMALLSRQWLSSRLDWIPAALEVSLIALHVVILMIGLVVMFRPSLLKQVERTANHWQKGPATTSLDAVMGGLDDRVQVYPRFSGLLLVLATGWCLLVLAPVAAAVLAR